MPRAARIVTFATGPVLAINWTGGGLDRVFRSDSPLFPSATTTVLTPAGGTSQTSFLDAAPAPSIGSAAFYLVMNQF